MVNLSFLLFFVCGISLSKASTTETIVAHISPGSNAKIEKDQLTDFLTSFTVCSGFFQIFSDRLMNNIFTINAQDEQFFIGMYFSTQENTTVYIQKENGQIISSYINGSIFPLQWNMFCLSMDSLTGRIKMTFDAQLIFDKIQEDFVGLDWGAWPLTFQLGSGSRNVSNLNVFSSALPVEKMKALTEAGGDECGSPGDFLRWDEASSTLNDTAKLFKVDPREGPCWKKSQVHVYSGELRQEECMQLCQKVGDERSPPVGTLHQWETFTKELEAITNQTSHFRYIWLSSVVGNDKADGRVVRFEHWSKNIVPMPNVWRDYYTGHPSDNLSNVPSSSDFGNRHCMVAWFNGENGKEAIWIKQFCLTQELLSCACQKKSLPPVLRLLGLCGASTLRGDGSDRSYGMMALQEVFLAIQFAYPTTRHAIPPALSVSQKIWMVISRKRKELPNIPL